MLKYKAQTDLYKFKDDAWIHFKYIDGLMIAGGGTFDGQGASAWPHNHCGGNLRCKLLPSVIVFIPRILIIQINQHYYVNVNLC